MNSFERERFRNAVKYGSDREIQEAARDIFEHSVNRAEVAGELARILKAEKRWQAWTFGNEVRYDGLTIKKGLFPEVRTEDC